MKFLILRIIFFSITCMCITTDVVHAQSNLNFIKSSFDNYRTNSFTEKIYTHTDKDYYMAGEIVWFKLYNTEATSHKPVNISKVAYVEILDTANKAVLQAKIGLQDGEGQGSLYLPQNIASGNYLLRAYTSWMKNFDPAYFFEKQLTIVNVQKTKLPDVSQTSSKYDIQFFPEGGDLVDGLESKVAFKAIASDGKSFDFTGYLLDNADTVLQFKPAHTGMGNFTFTPKNDHSYKAVIYSTDGFSILKELPVIYNNGYNMLVTDNGGDWKIIVQCNIAAIKEISLLAHTRGLLRYSSSANIQNGKAVFTITKSLLGDGITQFTAFNDQGKAVSERLVFKKPSTLLSLSADIDEQNYQLRKKVNIDISLANADTASLSMAVYRLDSLQALEVNSIETYLYLSSDIKGYIEDPSYYFNASTKEANEALDNLMLTQGWRRFKWNDVLMGKIPTINFTPETNGHIVKGRVISTRTGATQNLIETYLSSPGSMTQFKTCVSDSNGMVKYEFPNFYGGTSLIAQPNTTSDTINKIEIEDPFSKNYSTTKFPDFQRPNNYPNTILDQSISMQVQNIYTGEKQKQFFIPSYLDTSAFYVTTDLKYALDDYTRFTSMEEVLREYVAFVNVTRRGGRVHLPVINTAENVFFQTDPLVLMDGVPFFNFNKLLEFDPLKIRNLDVVTKRYIYGTSVFEGVLNWKTYSPSLANFDFPSNVNVLDYEGLQLEREFYSPAYNTPEASASHLPDFRNVLEWKPNIKLNNKNKASIEFYTSDLAGKYAVVIQGLSANGLCGSKIITFNVTK